jgi:hypothetical protein
MTRVSSSFTETVNSLTKSTNIALESLIKLNNTITTKDDTVVIQIEGKDAVTGDTSIYKYSIPSYNHVLSELSRVTNNMDTFVSGKGIVLLKDGTYREVKTIPVAKAPTSIKDIASPTTFNVRNNWFFESMIFPQMYVEFNLKRKIDDQSDRVVVRRVIFDNFNDDETTWFRNNVINSIKSLTYYDLTTLLDRYGKSYWLDEEVQNLPLKSNKYTGRFRVLKKPTISGKQWYYLNTINYGLTSDNLVVKNVQLKTGDQLRFNDNIFKITDIEVTEKRVTLTTIVGLGSPNINSFLDIYVTPFEEKTIQIPVGYSECQSVFIKGVNDDFNIIGDDWGNAISFYSGDLLLSSNNSISFETYYFNNVVDFGKELEGQAKEKFVSSFYGVQPDAPILVASQFGVNQINNQINAALDTDYIKKTQTQIESTKSIINSLKSTISLQKAQLVEITDAGERSNLQSKIDYNIDQLSKKTIEYQSLVKSLATLAYENNAVDTNPKYRVRGFFNIPTGKRFSFNSNERAQEIIQFEIWYRYLRLDNTGNPLNKYTYLDPSTGQMVTGTFSDWNSVTTPIRKKRYNRTKGLYEWLDENVADGETININQLDIPITKGEKVQIKIRSISEAGWPANPQRSEWSNVIMVEFPSNLEGSDQVQKILEDSVAEEETIKLDETLESAGVNTHLNDSIPNPNSGTGTYFKHQAQYLSYDVDSIVDEATGVASSVVTSNLQTFLDDFEDLHYVTVRNQARNSRKTVTLQSIIQLLVDSSSSIFTDL